MSLSTQAQVINCGDETVEQVNACTINDKLPLLLKDISPSSKWKDYKDYIAVDTCVSIVDDPETLEVDETFTCPVWEPTKDSYTFLPYDKDAPLGLYERLLIDNKPELSVFESALITWKAGQLAEVAFQDRVKALPNDIRMEAVKCNLNQPNMALLIKHIKENKDHEKLSCLESKKIEVANEVQAEKVRSNRVKKGRQAREFCNMILDMIAGFNLDRGLTEAQIDDMETTFVKTQKALQSGRPDKAKKEIVKINPDGILVTQEMKDAVLLEFGKIGL